MLVDGRKVAGVLVEGRPQEGWAVVGIGVNVAVDPGSLQGELRDRAGTLGRAPAELEAVLAELLAALEHRLGSRSRRPWRRCAGATRCSDSPCAGPAARAPAPGSTTAARLLVVTAAGERLALDAGEVHLGQAGAAS